MNKTIVSGWNTETHELMWLAVVKENTRGDVFIFLSIFEMVIRFLNDLNFANCTYFVLLSLWYWIVMNDERNFTQMVGYPCAISS